MYLSIHLLVNRKMNDFQQAFRNELFYPDILPFEEDLFDSLSDKLYYLVLSVVNFLETDYGRN